MEAPVPWNPWESRGHWSRDREHSLGLEMGRIHTLSPGSHPGHLGHGVTRHPPIPDAQPGCNELECPFWGLRGQWEPRLSGRETPPRMPGFGWGSGQERDQPSQNLALSSCLGKEAGQGWPCCTVTVDWLPQKQQGQRRAPWPVGISELLTGCRTGHGKWQWRSQPLGSTHRQVYARPVGSLPGT